MTQVNRLGAKVVAYAETNPIKIEPVRLDDPPRVEFVVESVAPPPVELPLLVGELVHNLRTSLDHLAGNLRC